jgi:hypothetical protein
VKLLRRIKVLNLNCKASTKVEAFLVEAVWQIGFLLILVEEIYYR